MSNAETVDTGLRQLLGGVGAAATQVARRRSVRLAVDAAGKDLTERVVFAVPSGAASGITITSVTYVPSASMTASDTLYETLTVKKYDAAGANGATVATRTTKTSGSGGSGSWTAFVGVTLTLTAANATVVAGGAVTFAYAKTSTGTDVPIGSLEIEYLEN